MIIKKFFAVTGNPVLHSKSPQIFNYLFSRMNINDSAYSRVASSNAEESIFMFKKLHLNGMNITAPFKEDIMKFLDEIDPEAKIIGGVNTVVLENKIIKGYNTDYLGVINSIANNNINLKNKKILALGAGGAGKGAIYGLVKNNARVMIVNRTKEKAKILADIYNCEYSDMDNLKELLKNYKFIISTLSPNIDVVREEWLNKSHIIFDANYKYSPLVEKGIKKGCRIIKGEEWLINQALPAFNLFLKRKPDINFDYNILKNSKKKIQFFIYGTQKLTHLVSEELSGKLNFHLAEFENIIPDNNNENKKIIPVNEIDQIDSLNPIISEKIKNSSIFIYLYDSDNKNFPMNFYYSDFIINCINKKVNEIIEKTEYEIKKIFC